MPSHKWTSDGKVACPAAGPNLFQSLGEYEDEAKTAPLGRQQALRRNKGDMLTGQTRFEDLRGASLAALALPPPLRTPRGGWRGPGGRQQLRLKTILWMRPRLRSTTADSGWPQTAGFFQSALCNPYIWQRPLGYAISKVRGEGYPERPVWVG